MITEDKFNTIEQEFFELNMLYSNLSSAIKYFVEHNEDPTPLMHLAEIIDEKFSDLSKSLG